MKCEYGSVSVHAMLGAYRTKQRVAQIERSENPGLGLLLTPDYQALRAFNPGYALRPTYNSEQGGPRTVAARSGSPLSRG